MTDYMKMISVFANSNSDYYCFSDEDSNGNIRKFILDGSKDKDRALDEMSRYMSIINKNNTFHT